MLDNDCEYLKALVTLLLDADDMEDGAALGQLFTIFRGLIILNSETLIITMMKEDFFLNVMRALTCK